MRAVALLSWWQLKNSIRTLFTDPKKLLPALFFAIVIGFNLWVVAFEPPERGGSISGVAGFVMAHQAESHAALFIALAAGALVTLGGGFTGKALIFSLSDVDYLFPSPIPRKVVLAYKLPALWWRHAMSALALVYVAYIFIWKRLPGGAPSAGESWLLFLGAALYLAFYSNIATAFEVAFGLGRAALAARVVQVALALMVIWAVMVVWHGGLPGLRLLERNAVFAVVFYPCRLMADLVLAPMTNINPGYTVTQLGVLCLGSVAAAVYVSGNFYEATLDTSERVARVRQAVREGNAFSAWRVRATRHNKPDRDFSRPYAIEPFGKGVVAVFWAHLCAMTKRPLIYFVGPFAVGMAISIGAMVWLPASAAVVPMGVGGYALLMLAAAGWQVVYAPAVQRRGLMRSLPIAPWKLVAAEVLGLAIPGTLAAWGAGLPLLAGDSQTQLGGALLMVCAPPLLLYVLLAAYAVAFWYPKRSDKVAQLLGGLVMMLGMGVMMIWLAVIIAPFIVLRMPIALLVSVPVGCAVACAALLPIAASAFVKAEVEG